MFAAAVCAFALFPAIEPAYADPEEDHSIEDELADAIEEYTEAEEFLEETEERQEELEEDIADAEERVEELSEEVNDFAESAYRNGELSSTVAWLSSGSPESAIEGLSMVGYLGDQTGNQLQELLDAQDGLEADRELLDEEVADAEDALESLESALEDAQAAVDEAGSGPGSGGGGNADPAPRNPDGSWPSEGCTVDDPTTGGCITPRMNHAYNEAQNAGFTRHTSCYRGGGGGEHPQGRACDMAAPESGFGSVAEGADKEYGDNLADFFVANSDALGVMYVIWYNEFWDPANGWGAYSGGGTGNPSQDHTDHVHVSVF